MTDAWEIAIAAATLVMNAGILLFNAKIREDISGVKVYMHEKFLTREEFFYTMNVHQRMPSETQSHDQK